MYLYVKKWNKFIDKIVFMYILEIKIWNNFLCKKGFEYSWKILLGEKLSMCGIFII